MLREKPATFSESGLRRRSEPLTPSLIRAALRETRPHRFDALQRRVNAIMRTRDADEVPSIKFDAGDPLSNPLAS